MSRAVAIPIIIGAGLLFALQSQAERTPGIPDGDILITDNDTVWDYKREGGIWWTRRKENSTWLNMRKELSDEMYNEAMQVLESYLQKKYRTIEFVAQ
jgi:hypothetical protein